jgi:hypothetical protein
MRKPIGIYTDEAAVELTAAADYPGRALLYLDAAFQDAWDKHEDDFVDVLERIDEIAEIDGDVA